MGGEAEVAAAGAAGASRRGSSGLSPLCLPAHSSGRRVGHLGGLGWSSLVQVAEGTLPSSAQSLPGACVESAVRSQMFSAFFSFKNNRVCFFLTRNL